MDCPPFLNRHRITKNNQFYSLCPPIADVRQIHAKKGIHNKKCELFIKNTNFPIFYLK